MTEDFTSERDFHQAFEKWLKGEGLLFVTSRMDRATTQQVGEPDYLVIELGHVLPLELKMEKGKLSTAQVFRHAEYAKASTLVHVARSLTAAIAVVTAWRSMLGESPAIRARTGAIVTFGARKYREVNGELIPL